MLTNRKPCEMCKIFSNGSRVGILLALREKALTVTEITDRTGLSQSVASQHLAILRNKGVLDYEKSGSWITYKLKYPEIMDAFDIMRGVTNKISGVKK
jgi:DNA-binding transcriptional ArsR family regulator